MTATRNFTTPVGRLVGGDVFKARDKDFEGRPLMTRDNKPRVEYLVQVAFPKSNPATEALREEVKAVARESFPSLFASGQPPRDFSFKEVDGDSTVPNQRGRIPAEREGYPGHYVLTFKSAFAPKVFDRDKLPIVDEKAIKRGDWVRLYVSAKGNASQGKPGVYLNHTMLQLCGYGEAISVGPDAQEVFAMPVQLPAGASPTPVAPSAPMPGAGNLAGAANLVVAQPMPGFGVPASGSNGSAAAPPAPAPPAPVAVVKQTRPGAPTYESLVAAGWTDDQMRAAGYLA